MERLESEETKTEGRKTQQGFVRRNKNYLVVLGVVALFVCCLIIFGYYQSTLNRDLIDALKSSNPRASTQHGDSLLSDAFPLLDNSDKTREHYINIGLRQDYLLQECQGTHFKLSFPDIDYALMGYNILRGYPLATGHDPGFTYPIFAANYEKKKHTADCRYSVPQGLVVVPDVSCITSFTSKVVQTQYEFANSLSTSASVSGGGWGVTFSASAGYKQSSSQISTGESVFIISSAKCNYYFSKLVKREPPPLDPVFLDWIERLSKTNADDTYIEFLDTYGTHFPTEVTFGARFTYEHKMSSKKYESESEKGVNVAVSASYSGIINIGGGFSLDTSQKQKASEFSKSVETKTISVGAAPPANGDAMTWASTVKNSPVPSTYKLSSIEELFTEKYLNTYGYHVNLAHIAENIKKKKDAYCASLLSRGEVDSCQSLSPGLMLDHTRLYNHYDSKVSSYKECIDHCLKLIKCVAITFCDTCDSKSHDYRTCYMYNTDRNIIGRDDKSWKSVMFIGKAKKELVFTATEITGNARATDIDVKSNKSECEQACIEDAHCIVFSYCDSEKVEQKCKMYSFSNVEGFKEESETTTVFVAK